MSLQIRSGNYIFNSFKERITWKRRRFLTSIVRDILRKLTPATDTSLFAMFKAYFDEGGITKSDRAAAFAGFMGDETRCDETAMKWAEIVQPIGEFHATEFFGRGASGCVRTLL